MAQQRKSESRGRRVACLVRHGHFDRPDQTASAHRILPLSDSGRAQAARGADRILETCRDNDLQLDTTIEVSQLLRAWETGCVMAEELSKRLDERFHVEERDEIIERGLGSCANLRFDEIEASLALDPRIAELPKGWRRLPEFRLPVQGAESLMEAGARTSARIEQSIASISDADPRDLVRIFVAHSGCLRHAAVHLGVIELAEVSGLSMDFCQSILVEQTEEGWHQIAGEWKQHLSSV